MKSQENDRTLYYFAKVERKPDTIQVMKKAMELFTDRRNLLSFYILGILCVLTPLHEYGNTPIQRIFQTVYICWTLILLLHELFTKRLHFDHITMVLCFLFSWACVSYLLQPKAHGIIPLKHLATLLMMIMLVFPMTRYFTKDEMMKYFEKLAEIIIIAVIIMNIMSLVYYALYRSINFPAWINEMFASFSERNGRDRYAGIYYHPVMCGSKCFFAMVFCIILYRSKKISFATAALTYLTSAVMIFLADPRTNYVQICMAALYAVYLPAAGKHGEKQALQILALCCITGITALCILKQDRIIGLFTGDLNQISSNRIIIWKTAWQEFLKRPLLGWGWENGEALLEYTNAYVENCHNIVFNLLLWTGIPGAAAFLIFTFTLLKRIRENKFLIRKGRYGWFVLITAALYAQSLLDILIIGEDVRISTPLFWMIAGMLYYLNKTKEIKV